MHKVRPRGPTRTRHITLSRLPLAAAICLAMASPAVAEDAAQNPTQNQSANPPTAAQVKTKTLDAVTVTAQKREENLQKVPISLQVLDSEKLQELHVQNFNDYVKYLPSVSYQTYGPGFALIYMRGVASGGDGNHSASQPSVGVYLDEQPVTTIQGPLDIHMYDIARVESLSGPQGTLYGASAEAGAIRIITNKPDPSGFAASYSAGVNSVSHGGVGYTAEGMVNIPMSPGSAIRLVGWSEHDAGYINNEVGSRTFPTSGITVSNAAGCSNPPNLVCTGQAKKDYNDVDIQGGRAALRFDLNDDWSISPTIMGQHTITNGAFASDPQVGSLALTHYYPDYANDRWVQAALTVEGKIGNFDLTYAYSHLTRNQEEDSDYSDYSFWYDTIAHYGAYIQDNAGNLINPSQYIQAHNHYTKQSHELRIASPADDRLRLVGGVFFQRQVHEIQQDYLINGLATSLSVTGWPNTLWLTQQERVDRDEALFGEMSYDFIPETLIGTIGGRWFHTDNSLKGFYGFSAGFAPTSTYGEAGCISTYRFHGAPCLDFDKATKETDSLGKANLTWQITPDKMIYGTWSEGFRPGGINRRGSLPPYKSDFLTNYELGWKTTWLDHRLSYNGAIFRENWKDFQFSILGANGLTEIRNAGQARINGIEQDVNWAATYNLQIGAGMAYYDAKLTQDYCGFTDTSGNPITNCPAGSINPITGAAVTGPLAPKGTRLPVTPKLKYNVNARYTTNIGDYEVFGQVAVVHVGERTSDLRVYANDLIGNMPAYTTADFTAGVKYHGMTLDVYINNAFDERGQLFRYAECAAATCAAHNVVPQYPNGQVYTVMNQPRTVGIRFSQEF